MPRLLCLFFILALSRAHADSISLSTNTVVTPPGGPVLVTVSLDNSTPLSALSLRIDVDSSVASIIETIATPERFANNDSSGITQTITGDRLTWSVFDLAGGSILPAGEGLLLTMRIDSNSALALTTTPVSIIVDSALDSSLSPVAIAASPGSITGVPIPYQLVAAGSALSVGEGAGSDSYTLALDSPPPGNVTVHITPDNSIVASPDTLIFTPEDFSEPQRVTITAIDDDIPTTPNSTTIRHTLFELLDSVLDLPVSIAPGTLSIADFAPSGLPAQTTLQINLANDRDLSSLGFRIPFDPSAVQIDAVNHNLPADKTTITVDNGNGLLAVSVTDFFGQPVISAGIAALLSLDITASTGLPCGGSPFPITNLSAFDTGLNAVPLLAVGGHIHRAAASLVVTGDFPLQVREGDSGATYTLALSCPPSEDVRVSFANNSQLAAGPAPIIFNTSNWDQPRTVTVTAVADLIPEGLHSSSISHLITSDDPAFAALTPPDISAEIIENNPVAEPDSFFATEDQDLEIPAPGLLDNDRDPNDGALSALLVSQPQNGSVSLTSDGAFTYLPLPNFEGLDTFSYRASNGSTDSAPALVSITVEPAPETITLDLRTGWNLVSLPLTPLNDTPEEVFRSAARAVSSTLDVFAYDSSTDAFSKPNAIVALEGYWILAPAPTTVSVTGFESREIWGDSLAGLAAGRHIRGVATTTASPHAPARIDGIIWRWNGRRFVAVPDAALLQPGEGYWLRLR